MFKRILVPVDGSEPSGHALRTALSLARESGGSVRLVHVLERTAYLAGYDPAAGSSGQLFHALRESGERVLREGMEAARAAGVPADPLLVEGSGARLADEVAQAAAAFRADLVVVGTHGRSGPARLLLGSGAEQITRQAPAPVLVVR